MFVTKAFCDEMFHHPDNRSLRVTIDRKKKMKIKNLLMKVKDIVTK